MEHFIVSARKYRPQRFDTVLGQGNIAATLKNAILRKQLAHAYLFCGPRGVGKTTCARIFAKAINCLTPLPDMEACGVCESCRSFSEGRSYCIHELDAASNNSVEDIRQLIEKVRIPPQIGTYSVYIIDEVHMLSQAAFNAFLKTLEEPPSYALFILATTEKHKILPTILSRCQIFDFNRIGVSEMIDALTKIAEHQEVRIEPEALHVLAVKADGAMRDALTLYDQTVAFCGKDITYQQVISNLNVLDYEYYFKLTDSFLQHRYIDALTLFDEVLAKGFNALYFIAGLSSHFRDLLVAKEPATLPLLEMGSALAARYAQQAASCSFPFLFDALRTCAACEAGYKTSGNPRLHIELTMVKLSQKDIGERTTAATAATVATVATVATGGSAPATTATVTPPARRETPTVQTTPVHPALPDAAPQRAGLHPDPTVAAPTLSINALLKKEQQKTVEQPEQHQKTEQNDPFTLEQLHSAWVRLSETFQTRPRLSATLSANLPRLEGDTSVLFVVESDAQREWIEQNCLVAMRSFLQKELRNDFVTLTLETKRIEENDRSRLYMPEEKAKFLFETHPQVKGLKDDLQLELA